MEEDNERDGSNLRPNEPFAARVSQDFDALTHYTMPVRVCDFYK